LPAGSPISWLMTGPCQKYPTLARVLDYEYTKVGSQAVQIFEFFGLPSL
jgi:hypothetical protein